MSLFDERLEDGRTANEDPRGGKETKGHERSREQPPRRGPAAAGGSGRLARLRAQENEVGDDGQPIQQDSRLLRKHQEQAGDRRTGHLVAHEERDRDDREDQDSEIRAHVQAARRHGGPEGIDRREEAPVARRTFGINRAQDGEHAPDRCSAQERVGQVEDDRARPEEELRDREDAHVSHRGMAPAVELERIEIANRGKEAVVDIFGGVPERDESEVRSEQQQECSLDEREARVVAAARPRALELIQSAPNYGPSRGISADSFPERELRRRIAAELARDAADSGEAGGLQSGFVFSLLDEVARTDRLDEPDRPLRESFQESDPLVDRACGVNRDLLGAVHEVLAVQTNIPNVAIRWELEDRRWRPPRTHVVEKEP